MDKLLRKFSIWLTFIAILIDKTHGKVRCYECFVAPRRTENRTSYEKLCTKFDESKPFERECPYSTMCIKKTYRLELLNGDVQETIERGCAMQKYDYMNYVNNKWVKEVSVEEPYSEGCVKKDGYEECHCRGNFCNPGVRIEPNFNIYTGIDTMSILVVFNLVKYFRNMDYL